VRCADEDECVDDSPANKTLVVEQAKVAENVEIIGDICGGDEFTAQASSPSSGCRAFQYRWTISAGDGSNVQSSGWSAQAPYPTGLRAPEPGDKVKVEAKCAETGECVDDQVISTEKEIKQKIKAESVSIEPVSMCSGTGRKLKAVASAPGCNRVEYRWQVNGGAWSAWSTEVERTFNAVANDRIRVSARCADNSACVDNVAVNSSELVVSPTKVLDVGEIIGYDEAICQRDLAELSLKANILPSTTCSNLSYAWYLNDGDDPIATTKDLIGYDFPVGKQQVKLVVTCNDNPCPPEPKLVEKTKKKVLPNLKKQEIAKRLNTKK
jgi:hypothetical protein